MKVDKTYLIIFFSTQETLYAEKALKKNRLKHELVPPPERVKTECGLAIKVPASLKNRTVGAITEEGLTIRGVYRQEGNRWIEESSEEKGEITSGKVYLDYNATSPLDPEVRDAMDPYYQTKYGNASSIHSFGREARAAVDEAREKVAGLIGAGEEEIVFTSGGSEADNFAIKGMAYAHEHKGKHIITSSTEHQAILNTCEYLQGKGFHITYLPVDKYGLVDPENLKQAFTEETILVSIMLANNEIGTIQPIKELAKITRERKVYFHTDAVQAIGKIPVDVEKLGVDLLSLSGHKFYGPKGAGALYIKKGIKIDPLIHGGHHERQRRAGTENVPGIVGLGKTSESTSREMENRKGHLLHLRDKLEKGIGERIDDVKLNGHPQKRLPNTLNISFKFIEGESLIINLDLKGVAVSTGSACTSGSLKPSHVLLAMGVSPKIAQGSIRFSLGKENREEDIDYVLDVLPEIVDRLRKISPLYKGS